MRWQKIQESMARDIILWTIWLMMWGLLADVAIAKKAVPKRAVAIITFENLSDYPENDWVGSSFGESLTTKLSKLESLELYERRQLSEVLAASNLDQHAVSEEHWDKAEEIGSTLHLKGVQSGAV